VHPAILRRLDVAQRVLFGEFNLQDLMQVAKKKKISDLPLYPGSERDWTLTIWKTVPYEQIIASIKEQHSPILESVSLLDIYRNEKLGQEYQNITLHFVYRDPSKTIEQEDVEAEHQRLTTVVLNKLGDAVKS
jgi:phenylalanyl-tRNA synthetase beta chain